MTEAEARRIEHRKVFEQNLLKEGLQLELEHKNTSFDGKTYFLKLHIPWKTKMQYAEVMNLKLPTKRFITISVKAWVSFYHSEKVLLSLIRISSSYELLQGDEGGEKKSKYWDKWMPWIEKIQRLHTWNTTRYPEEPSFYASADLTDREER